MKLALSLSYLVVVGWSMSGFVLHFFPKWFIGYIIVLMIVSLVMLLDWQRGVKQINKHIVDLRTHQSKSVRQENMNNDSNDQRS